MDFIFAFIFNFVTSILGSYTSVVLAIVIVGSFVLAYAVGSIKSPPTKRRRRLFMGSLVLIILGIVLNSIISLDSRSKTAQVSSFECLSVDEFKPRFGYTINFEKNTTILIERFSNQYGYSDNKPIINVLSVPNCDQVELKAVITHITP